MSPSRRTLRDLATLVLLAALLGAVYLLPPDTSLAEVERQGTLDVCVPASYPPLVTSEPERPGLDIELLRAAAGRMHLRLTLTVSSGMGRDFNPRSWRITRAKCHVVAGGVLDTPTTRSLLDVTRPHAETGWAAVLPAPAGTVDPAGVRVGVLPGAAGIDRLALTRYLRAEGAAPEIVTSPEALKTGLRDGRFDLAITEALLASRIAAEEGWTARWLPGLPVRYPVVFGIWKGDLTLKRALESALVSLDTDGTAEAIRNEYLGPAVGT